MRSGQSFAFGAFLLIPGRQLLLRDNSPVRIGGRALDLLIALVERSGELVTKNELMARAWPTTTVDEGNLKVNVAALRRALDDDAGDARYIATVTGRGYRFIAPIETRTPAPLEPPLLEGQPDGRSLRTAHDPAADTIHVIQPGRAPLSVEGPHDPVTGSIQPCAAKGTRIRFVDLPPDANDLVNGRSINEIFEAVDYGIVIDGEITLLLDGTTVLLKPGSLVVQRGVTHGWANLSGKPCRMLFVDRNGHFG